MELGARELGKAIFLCSMYGGSPSAVAQEADNRVGTSATVEAVHAGQEVMWRTYPAIHSWHRRVDQERLLEARSLLGRLRVFDTYVRGEVLCAPVQATVADGMKAALIALHVALKPFGARVVHVVYDEVIVETPIGTEARVGALVREVMVEEMSLLLHRVRIEVAISARTSWAE